MPGLGGHYEFYNDRAHAEQYFAEKHPHVAVFREKLYARQVSAGHIYTRAHIVMICFPSECPFVGFALTLTTAQVIPVYKSGDVLLYRYDIWHRGTPVNQGHRRSVINIAWTKRQCFWNLMWNPAWTKGNYYGKTEEVLVRMSPKQRALVGVPEPGHECWTEARVRGFGARYPGIPIQPYLEKL